MEIFNPSFAKQYQEFYDAAEKRAEELINRPNLMINTIRFDDKSEEVEVYYYYTSRNCGDTDTEKFSYLEFFGEEGMRRGKIANLFGVQQ